MKNLELENYGVNTLSFENMLSIDGGGFWHTFGVICAICCVVAAAYATGGLVLALL